MAYREVSRVEIAEVVRLWLQQEPDTTAKAPLERLRLSTLAASPTASSGRCNEGDRSGWS